jgi:hypothetical protein
MKYNVKIRFRFHYDSTMSVNGAGTMEMTVKQSSDVSYDHAISLAWKYLASDMFDRNLISNTSKIEIISKDKSLKEIPTKKSVS